MAVKISIHSRETPIGQLLLAAGEDGVTGIEFDRGNPEAARDELRRRLTRRFGKEPELVENSGPLAGLIDWLKRYFNNPRAAGRYNGPLDPGGSEFQRAVWRQLAEIPAGTVQTYGRVAAAIGNPGAVRAVGNACGANPIPLVVPCHRVVAAGGPGGFGGGMDLKRKLLAAEGYQL